jgi:LacI family transcriptional regulator
VLSKQETNPTLPLNSQVNAIFARIEFWQGTAGSSIFVHDEFWEPQIELGSRYSCGSHATWMPFGCKENFSHRVYYHYLRNGNLMAHTMSDVAKLAGVSSATVSRVLSKSPYISASTVGRVLAAVKELRYYPNVHARRLASGKSDLFGLVISEIANPFFPEVIRGFQSAAWDRGFDVLLLNTEYSKTRTDSVIKKLIESDVRGAAIMTSSLGEEVIKPLTEAGIGVVFCNMVRARRLVSNIKIDYKPGIVEAIEHVVSLGHSRVAVIAGPEQNRTAKMIKQALISGLRRHGLNPDPVTFATYHLNAGISAVQAILSAKTTPTVIFCGSDLIAMGVLVALEEAGIDVARDMSVVGIDDISFAFLTRPPMTTIRVPREQLGLTAFHALDKMLKRKTQKGAEYEMETELVIRKSTAPARRRELATKTSM